MTSSQPPKEGLIKLVFPPLEQPKQIGRFFPLSISNDLVKFLGELECLKCRNEFPNDKDIFLSVCGHFSCSACMETDDRPVYENRDDRSIIFSCSLCRTGNNTFHFKTQEERDTLSSIKFPLLKDLNKYLRDWPGARAFQCAECQEFHPENNTLVCEDYCHERREGVKSAFYCVWCAEGKHTNGCYLRIPLFYDNPSPRLNGEKLSSIDRTLTEKFGIPLLVCCGTGAKCVDGSLENVTDPTEFRVFPLHCSHLAHWFCVNGSGKRYNECVICKARMDLRKVEMNEQEMLRKFKYTTEIAQKMGSTFECKGRCKGIHPVTNKAQHKDDRCVWCSLEERQSKFVRTK